MFTILFLHEFLVFLLLILSGHPRHINSSLHILLIQTESLVVRHDQVDILTFFNVHMHLIVLHTAVHRPTNQQYNHQGRKLDCSTISTIELHCCLVFVYFVLILCVFIFCNNL